MIFLAQDPDGTWHKFHTQRKIKIRWVLFGRRDEKSKWQTLGWYCNYKHVEALEQLAQKTDEWTNTHVAYVRTGGKK